MSLPLPDIPAALAELRTLALDLRWTWNHATDALWRQVEPDIWARTHNPWSVLQNTTSERLHSLVSDEDFRRTLAELSAARTQYLQRPGWFHGRYPASSLNGIAYFSMEFGIGSALPLYAGGLGVLAGDYLKAASDLDVPVIGIGLLFQEGYFRQIIDASGRQHELYPHNEPAVMPIEPVILPQTGWLKIMLSLPGRDLRARVWQARIGRIKLYLLDTNDAMNKPVDRGITAKLYSESSENRLMQEIVLGVGGWRVIEALHPRTEICHINEGHAAFAIVERARALANAEKLSFLDAFWASRAGNLFTTHTPVPAGFDKFPAEMLRKYLLCLECSQATPDAYADQIISLGLENPANHGDRFNMAYLAQRGAAITLGVSRLHGEFSRKIFQPLFPRWPACEVPVGHITNGVHIPTWDSIEADSLWTTMCGTERWRGASDDLQPRIAAVTDDALWSMRNKGRQRLVEIARRHLATQLRERGLSSDVMELAGTALDPNALTVGFARRFTGYKRPNLLLREFAKIDRLLGDEARPLQIVIAGKAHPADLEGKNMIAEWIGFARTSVHRRKVVFLEDYDITLAQEMVQGVDVWLNTPRRPWEACGTSGMKVLVNGGLNCSIRDGWWDEAFRPDLGWAIGDGRGGNAPDVDKRDADSLFDLLENEIIPEFYGRDRAGMPRAWLSRIRKSMSELTPAFSSARMMKDYLESAYLPLAQRVRGRLEDNCRLGRDLGRWAQRLQACWHTLSIGEVTITERADGRYFAMPIFLGEISPEQVSVELFAEARGQSPAEVVPLRRGASAPGQENGYIFAGLVANTRPAGDYTVRVIPRHCDALLPTELPLILWAH